ncbi:MAG: YebC/PmpR family DNA-binding transcriptional regulator, partial [Candidatus Falkowbacteria bacterium]
MSGHSKWATTKRQKAVADAKRGAIFTKIAKLITIAARQGGDPTSNFSLRIAIDKAKSINMPKDNIERAVKRGTGESGGAQIEELIYEGIGPIKAQFIIKCLSDNKNRTAAEIRHLFSKHGGSLSAVMWNFVQHGIIMIESEEINDKKLTDENFELELI